MAGRWAELWLGGCPAAPHPLPRQEPALGEEQASPVLRVGWAGPDLTPRGLSGWAFGLQLAGSLWTFQTWAAHEHHPEDGAAWLVCTALDVKLESEVEQSVWFRHSLEVLPSAHFKGLLFCRSEGQCWMRASHRACRGPSWGTPHVARHTLGRKAAMRWLSKGVWKGCPIRRSWPCSLLITESGSFVLLVLLEVMTLLFLWDSHWILKRWQFKLEACKSVSVYLFKWYAWFKRSLILSTWFLQKKYYIFWGWWGWHHGEGILYRNVCSSHVFVFSIHLSQGCGLFWFLFKHKPGKKATLVMIWQLGGMFWWTQELRVRACVFEKVGETIRNGFKLKKKIYIPKNSP